MSDLSFPFLVALIPYPKVSPTSLSHITTVVLPPPTGPRRSTVVLVFSSLFLRCWLFALLALGRSSLNKQSPQRSSHPHLLFKQNQPTGYRSVNSGHRDSSYRSLALRRLADPLFSNSLLSFSGSLQCLSPIIVHILVDSCWRSSSPVIFSCPSDRLPATPSLVHINNFLPRALSA